MVEGLKEAVEAGKANGQDVVWEVGEIENNIRNVHVHGVSKSHISIKV